MTAAEAREALIEVGTLLAEIRGGMVPSMTPGATQRVSEAIRVLVDVRELLDVKSADAKAGR